MESEEKVKYRRTASPVNGNVLPRGKPFEQGEEQRERARRAGRKSGQVRRERKTLKEELLALLTNMEIPNSKGKSVPVQEAISSALIKQAVQGNVRAYETIRDTIGEKPIENVNLVSADFSALDEAFEKMGEKE